jgi:predicted acyltransferase
MKLLPVPGFAAGDLSPQGNFAFHLDRLLLGAHTWRYSPGPGDPEGILSTLPAIVTALFGIFCGELLRRAWPLPAKLWRMAAAGAVLTAAGLLLSPFFPLNKNLWSPTYVLFTAGLALLVLGAILYLVDRRKIDAWSRPFAIFGRNAILAFVGSGLLAKLLLVVFRWQEGEKTETLQAWLYDQLYVPVFPDYVASLAWALTHVFFWLAVLFALDRRGMYLKV